MLKVSFGYSQTSLDAVWNNVEDDVYVLLSSGSGSTRDQLALVLMSHDRAFDAYSMERVW
jgi:hypothetical protein